MLRAENGSLILNSLCPDVTITCVDLNPHHLLTFVVAVRGGKQGPITGKCCLNIIGRGENLTQI